jgi:hypothetical protein
MGGGVPVGGSRRCPLLRPCGGHPSPYLPCSTFARTDLHATTNITPKVTLMQILSRKHDRFIVELTYEESALIGGSLHLYHGTNELYHHPVPPGILEVANTFLWQGLIASLEARNQQG